MVSETFYEFNGVYSLNDARYFIFDVRDLRYIHEGKKLMVTMNSHNEKKNILTGKMWNLLLGLYHNELYQIISLLGFIYLFF